MAGVYRGGGGGDRENMPQVGGGHLQRRGVQVTRPGAASGGAGTAAAAQPPKEPHGQEPHNSTQIDIPTMIYDKHSRQTYTRGRLLGKGGFARCFEVVETKTNAVMACKIVNKSLLVKQHQREKMAQEIKIHRDLRHEFVVNFISYFEDDANVYITLELCSKKSLMELQKRRRIITEPEAKYFMRQICLAVQYLHDDKHIIHRDLKLGNIFISEDMCLKLGDFGLATTIEFDGERKKTLCGTPNYIAPEVLGKKGHSYQVDIWSIGCILYTLLIGRPPFETATLRDTYHKIKRAEYAFPQSIRISDYAKKLLVKCLQVNPDLRPSAKQIMVTEFMTHGHIPHTLPSSVLTMAPRFDRPKSILSSVNTQQPQQQQLNIVGRPGSGGGGGGAGPATAAAAGVSAPLFKKPLLESNHPTATAASSAGNANVNVNAKNLQQMQMQMQQGGSKHLNLNEEGNAYGGELNNIDILENMRNLRDQIRKIIDSNPKRTENDDESEDPSQAPMLWICKWVDYSDKYGFGYHLSDDSIGVSFNDATKIILLPDANSMHYIEKGGREHYHTVDSYPEDLSKKVKLLKYFQQYMQDNLMKATGGRNAPSPDIIARVPNMWTWFRTSRAVVMVLSNGTLQINNFRDHSKMILCPLLGALTTLGTGSKGMRTYKLGGMEKLREGGGGISPEMWEMLKYALEKVNVILGQAAASSASSNGGGGGVPTAKEIKSPAPPPAQAAGIAGSSGGNVNNGRGKVDEQRMFYINSP